MLIVCPTCGVLIFCIKIAVAYSLLKGETWTLRCAKNHVFDVDAK